MAVDTDRIRASIENKGFETLVARVDRLLDFDLKADDLVFYASAYNAELRSYIREILYFAARRARIIPSYDLMLAHENKGVQELLKKLLGIGNLEGEYRVDFDERSTPRPYVFKTSAGAGSAGVHLVRTDEDEQRIRRRYFSTSLLTRLKRLVRKQKLNASEFERYAYYYKPFEPYVTQRFVDGLSGDLKVLVFGDRFYTLWRENRPGDFRASGSGRLDLRRPCPPAALDFARDIAAKLGSPYVSLDIAEGSDGLHLLEFQALHFGPTTLTLSDGYYVERNGTWERVSAKPDLEESFAHAILHYLGQQSLVLPVDIGE